MKPAMIECYLIRISNGQNSSTGLVFPAEEAGLDLQQSLMLAVVQFSFEDFSVTDARKVMLERKPKNAEECYAFTDRLIAGLLGRN